MEAAFDQPVGVGADEAEIWIDGLNG